jgi:hypothetical protein
MLSLLILIPVCVLVNCVLVVCHIRILPSFLVQLRYRHYVPGAQRQAPVLRHSACGNSLTLRLPRQLGHGVVV